MVCVLAVLVCVLPIYATHSTHTAVETNPDYQLEKQKAHEIENSTYQQIQDLQGKILQIIEQIRLLRNENAHLSEVQQLKTEITNLENQMMSLIKL